VIDYSLDDNNHPAWQGGYTVLVQNMPVFVFAQARAGSAGFA